MVISTLRINFVSNSGKDAANTQDLMHIKHHLLWCFFGMSGSFEFGDLPKCFIMLDFGVLFNKSNRNGLQSANNRETKCIN